MQEEKELQQETTCDCEKEACKTEEVKEAGKDEKAADKEVNKDAKADDKEAKKDAKAEEKKSAKFSKRKRIEELEEEVAKLKEEVAASKNAYFKAYADAENLKKRLQSEADNVRKYRIQGFATEVLPVLDNLERALDVKVEDPNIKNYVKGFEMIYQQLVHICLLYTSMLSQTFTPSLARSNAFALVRLYAETLCPPCTRCSSMLFPMTPVPIQAIFI